MKVKDLRYIFGYTSIKKVDEKLSKGSAVFTPIKGARLKLAGYSQVIDLRDDKKNGSNLLRFLEETYCKIFNIKYINLGINLNDNKVPPRNFFEQINRIITEHKGKTYIHCHYGEHRTGQCIAMYQKSKHLSEDVIFKDLINSGWNKKSDFTGSNYNTLVLFIKKYFQNPEYLKKLRELKQLMLK